jgi:hypothetical protein
VATPLEALVVAMTTVVSLLDVGTAVEDGVTTCRDVVEVVGLAIVGVLDVDVVARGSSFTLPIIQYNLLISKSGQLVPGFKFLKSSAVNPQELEKLSQLASLVGVVEKRQSTPRRT